MVWKVTLWSIATVATFGQSAPKTAPIPGDPLEMITGQIQTADSPASRDAALRLLERARNSYSLGRAAQGYDLKVSFTVTSGGQTDYDGAWEMEDLFDPQQGLRWTAKAAAGYATTQISSNGMFYGAGTSSTIPLRLQEGRAALFDPIPASQNLERMSIRTSEASFNGTSVTCVLLFSPGKAEAAPSGRRWEETEECVDPQSGLLQVHSQVPGRYYAYDYSNAARLGDHVLPRKVTVTEGGQTVSVISVDSLAELPAADARLFVPTEEMKARGSATAMAGAQKISQFAESGPYPGGATAQPVCVFGLVTSSGQIVEAHSLQPSDPNSQAAVEAVRQMNFPMPARPGTRPQQHFVFVIEKFVSPAK